MKNCWNLKLSSLALLFSGLCCLSLQAQYSEPEEHFFREEKYLYPVNPGQRGSLAGNMGELRTSHFHSGIDIRTNNQIGHPVVASKSGYIARVGMGPTGYGNVIYIAHPDGNTTIYGHLDHFAEPLADYVLKEQYRKESFRIDLKLDKNKFPVKQGDLIAISGNTGSSGGPHVHFDIRDRNNDALNPLAFEFDEIVDKTAPMVEKVALVTLDPNSRINDRFGRFEFYAYRSGNEFTMRAPIMAQGNIGVELLAKDKFQPKDPFYGGVNYIDMRVNGQLAFRQSIEKIDITETRRIHVLMNYKTLHTTGKRFYKLYIDDGNTLPYYQGSPTSGKLEISGDQDRKIEIRMMDSFANTSTLKFTLRPSTPAAEVKNLPAAGVYPIPELQENVLMLTVQPQPGPDQKAFVYAGDAVRQITPAYYNTVSSVYLVDLRRHLPDSIITNNKTYVTHFRTRVPPLTDYEYYSDRVNIEFPVGALYDTLYLNTSVHKDKTSEVFTIGDRLIPLRQNIAVSYKPQKLYSRSKRVGVYRVNGKQHTYLGGVFSNGRISFQTREFGHFTIYTDTIPPQIRPVSLNNNTVRFKISDDLSGIDSYEAAIDGNWLLMHYDAKSNSIWSERLNKSEPLKGELMLTVTDHAGNKQTYTHSIP